MLPTRPRCTCTATTACRPCELVAARKDYRQLWRVSDWDGAETAGRIAPLLPSGTPVPPEPPYVRARARCIYEGAVVAYCTTCGPSRAKGRHTRGCGLFDTCTLEPVNDDVMDCRTCTAHVTDPDPGPDLE